MAQMTSGRVLREARERKGYDLPTVARRLRIRPDILKAIEAGDFSSMPPRGYTRNMVNAYARLLSLNPTEIVNMYLDEAYAYQVEKARGSAPGSGFNMERDTRRRRVSNRNASDLGSTRSYSTRPQQEPVRNSGASRSRHLYDDRTQYAHDGYGVTRERVQRKDRSDRDFLSHHSGYSADGYLSRDSGRQRGRTIHVGETPMQYTAPRVPAALKSRGVVIAAIALGILMIIAIIFFVTSNMHKPANDEVSKLPVSGITDTTGTADQDTSAAVEVAPTSSKVVITVPSGKECYYETYMDGQLDANHTGMFTGPNEMSFEVTGRCVITTYTPDNLKITVDGTAVTMAISEEYTGMYAYTVDFPATLEQWKSTHTSKTSQRQAAVNEASAAASAATSSSSSSSSQSSSSSTTAR